MENRWPPGEREQLGHAVGLQAPGHQAPAVELRGGFGLGRHAGNATSIIAGVIVDAAVYEEGRRLDGELGVAEAAACRRDGAFVWLGVSAPTAEEFDAIAREFGLHELAVEDAVHAHQRP